MSAAARRASMMDTMIAIAGGIVLAVLALHVVGLLGHDERGGFSLVTLIGNVFDIAIAVLLPVAAIAAVALCLLLKH